MTKPVQIALTFDFDAYSTARKPNAEFTRCDAYVARWKQGRTPTLPPR